MDIEPLRVMVHLVSFKSNVGRESEGAMKARYGKCDREASKQAFPTVRM